MFRIPILLSFLMCASLSHGADERSENIFSLDGEWVRLDDELLARLRAKWVGTSYVQIISVMDTSDVRWVLDYISVMELLNNRDCDKLELVETRDFASQEDLRNGTPDLEHGLFDYAWIVNSCGKLKTYRIVNPRDSSSLSVYQTAP